MAYVALALGRWAVGVGVPYSVSRVPKKGKWERAASIRGFGLGLIMPYSLLLATKRKNDFPAVANWLCGTVHRCALPLTTRSPTRQSRWSLVADPRLQTGIVPQS